MPNDLARTKSVDQSLIGVKNQMSTTTRYSREAQLLDVSEKSRSLGIAMMSGPTFGSDLAGCLLNIFRHSIWSIFFQR